MNIDPGAWVVIYCPKTGRFLLGQRGPSMHKPGLWNFFGGHLDADESAVAAILRELKEETGLTLSERHVQPIGEAGVIPAGYASGVREFHYFVLFTDSELVPELDDEHSGYDWFLPEKLPGNVNRPTAVGIDIGLLHKALMLAEEFGVV